ncbi:MAG: hypothetical protein ACLRNQ_21670 [Flavonifractor plautii]
MDFGSSGKGFYHTWWPHNGDRFNTPEFKEALQQFVDAVREDGPLKDLPSMGQFCLSRTAGPSRRTVGAMGIWRRWATTASASGVPPAPGNTSAIFTAMTCASRTLDRPVGRVSFANGEHMEFTAPQDYLRTIREEPPTKDGTGFRFETLTDDPAVRKAVDDMVYDLYGEENPRPLEDYVSRQGPEMGGRQM